LLSKNRIKKILELGVKEGVYPGAVLGVMERGRLTLTEAVGSLGVDDKKTPDEDTVYDLASLTKVLITTTSIMQLLEKGLLNLDDALTEFFPGAGEEYGDITIRHLLTHTSGLPPLVKLWINPGEKNKVLSYLLNLEVQSAPGSQVNYGDPNFILLGFLLERITGESLQKYAQKNIVGPLGLQKTGFNPLQSGASENINNINDVNNINDINVINDVNDVNNNSLNYNKIAEDEIAPTEFCSWRGKLIRGEVHDENSYFLGGVSGHAGLFSCLSDLIKLVNSLLVFENNFIESNGTNSSSKAYQLLHPLSLKLMQQTATSGGMAARGMGWDKGGKPYCSGGVYLDETAFGHTGFTGTSIWHEPHSNLTVILLTNRVNMGRENDKIISFRPRLHNLILTTLLQ